MDDSDLPSLSKFHSFLGIGSAARENVYSRGGKEKKANRVSFKSRWNDWHFHCWSMSKRVPKFQNAWNVSTFSRYVSFFFYFYCENFIFNIPISIDRWSILTNLYCFHVNLSLCNPCIVQAVSRACYSRTVFFLTRAQKLQMSRACKS